MGRCGCSDRHSTTLLGPSLHCTSTLQPLHCTVLTKLECAVQCSVVQCSAVQCSVLQHTTLHCTTLQWWQWHVQALCHSCPFSSPCPCPPWREEIWMKTGKGSVFYLELKKPNWFWTGVEIPCLLCILPSCRRGTGAAGCIVFNMLILRKKSLPNPSLLFINCSPSSKKQNKTLRDRNVWCPDYITSVVKVSGCLY